MFPRILRINFIVSVLLCASVQAQSVETIDLLRLDSLIHHQKKVLVLNLWATWCDPCREEMPDIITLSQKYHSSINVVGVSVDDPEDINSKVRPFLKEYRVPFPVFVSGIPQMDSLINYINPDWSGGIPATVLYNAKGERIKFLFGKRTLSDLINAVDEALGQP